MQSINQSINQSIIDVGHYKPSLSLQKFNLYCSSLSATREVSHEC